MKNLWTPWRMAYIEDAGASNGGCIFEAGMDKTNEKKSLLLFRNKKCVVLLNRFPYANGHLLIAPSRHVGDITDLLPDEISNVEMVSTTTPPDMQLTFKEAKDKIVSDFEKQYLIQALEKANGVIKEAAGLAGMHTKNFHEKMMKYNIQPKKNFI